MLQFSQGRIENTIERPLASGASIDAEGQALIAVYTAGVFGVKPSAGAAGEKFVGVSLSRPIVPGFAPVIERVVVPVGGVVPLRAAPVSSTARVVDAANNAAYTIVGGAPAAATEAQVSGSTIVLQAGQAGKTVLVTYLRALTVAQAVMLQGNSDIGGPAGAYWGQVGIITRGDVFTDQFDTTVDWTAPTDLKLGANGKFTLGGGGVAVPGHVISAPAEGAAFLGLHINAD